MSCIYRHGADQGQVALDADEDDRERGHTGDTVLEEVVQLAEYVAVEPRVGREQIRYRDRYAAEEHENVRNRQVDEERVPELPKATLVDEYTDDNQIGEYAHHEYERVEEREQNGRGRGLVGLTARHVFGGRIVMRVPAWERDETRCC